MSPLQFVEEAGLQTPGSIWVRAELLSEAVGAVVPKRRKNARKLRRPYPVSLVYIAEDKALGVKEAHHALRGYRVPAIGQWPDKVQVDGRVLADLVVKYPPDSVIELVALRGALAILQGKNQVRLKRLDLGNHPGIVETPPPRDRRHTGPVVMPPDRPPSGRFEWNDTWLFSARVPFPQHRLATGEARRPNDADRAEEREEPETGAGTGKHCGYEYLKEENIEDQKGFERLEDGKRRSTIHLGFRLIENDKGRFEIHCRTGGKVKTTFDYPDDDTAKRVASYLPKSASH